jgi:roadblock/LC7 domain-containing protein
MRLVPALSVIAVLFALQPPLVSPWGPGSSGEELIAEKDSTCPVSDEEDVVSPDGRRVAWRTRSGQQWSVADNGQRVGGTYDEVRFLTFSPDSRQLAFAARRDKRWMLVLDGAEPSLTYDEVGAPAFAPAAGRLAYGARRGKRWTMVVDGKEGTSTYSDVRFPDYSADGRRIAFAAKPAKKWVLIVDGEPLGAEFDQIVAGTFSPDGRRVAYVGRRGDKWVAVVDGTEGQSFDIVGGLAFSADSRRFAYAGVLVERGFAKEKGIGRAIVDGVAGPAFEGAQIGSFLTSMATGSTPHLVVGYFQQLVSATHGVTAPTFSPDGRRVSYAARRGKDAAAVMVDGEAGATFVSILAGPLFSLDSEHVALVVADAGTTSLVVDGVKVGPASSARLDFIDRMMFAPDNRRVAYVAVNGGDWYERGLTSRARRRVYVDGVAGTEYDARYLGRVGFTPDGRHFAYVVDGLSEASTEVSFVVVDATEGKRYDDIFGSLHLEPDGASIRYTARKGRKFYRVTQPFVEPETTF